MKRYEYQFIRVERESSLRTRQGDTFEQCKAVIAGEAEKGWRLVQVVPPFGDKAAAYMPYCYEIIFEREVD